MREFSQSVANWLLFCLNDSVFFCSTNTVHLLFCAHLHVNVRNDNVVIGKMQ